MTTSEWFTALRDAPWPAFLLMSLIANVVQFRLLLRAKDETNKTLRDVLPVTVTLTKLFETMATRAALRRSSTRPTPPNRGPRDE